MSRSSRKLVLGLAVVAILVVAVFVGISLMGPGKVSVSSVITSNGGTVEASGKIRLDVPSHAVRGSIKITIEEVDPPKLPEGMTGVGRAYDLGPDGLAFNASVRVTLYYTEDELKKAGVTDPSNLKIITYNETEKIWYIHSSTTVNATKRSVATYLTHFSPFTIGKESIPIEKWLNTLSGTVLSDKGETLDYAEVFLSVGGDRGYVGMCDSAGNYKIEFIKAGSYKAKAFGMGKCEPGKGFMYRWQYKEVSFTSTSPPFESKTLNFALEPAMGDVKVTVYEEKCEPEKECKCELAKGCSVKITMAGGITEPLLPISDGVYYECYINPGAATITVTKGDKTKTVQTNISPGETSSITVSFVPKYEVHIDQTKSLSGPVVVAEIFGVECTGTVTDHLVLDASIEDPCPKNMYGDWKGTVSGHVKVEIVCPELGFYTSEEGDLPTGEISFTLPEGGGQFVILSGGEPVFESCSLSGKTITLSVCVALFGGTYITFEGEIVLVEDR